MKLLVSLCILILPNCCLLLDTDGQPNPPSPFMFPRDRTKTALPRIIGGQEVAPHSYPFQVGLYIHTHDNSRYFCGGTLITRQWVLTAAHCLDLNAAYVLVHIGSHYVTSQYDPNRIILNSTTFIFHPGWDETIFQNDIGLVRLPSNVTLNDYVGTVKFTRGNDTFASRTGTMVGWGLTENAISISPYLNHVNSSILTNEACNVGIFQGIIVSHHICVAGTSIVGTCSGDSGGPLLVDGVQVGITSFGSSICTLGYSSVFTRISEFTDWIDQYVEDGGESLHTHYSLAISAVFCLYQLFIYT